MFSLPERDRPLEFLVRDNDGKFTRSFDTVFDTEGIRVIHTPVRAPKANAVAERFVGAVRRECLDWVLIVNRRHLQHVLAEFIAHYNGHRPHRALGLALPNLGTHRRPRQTRHPSRSTDTTGSAASSTSTSPPENDPRSNKCTPHAARRNGRPAARAMSTASRPFNWLGEQWRAFFLTVDEENAFPQGLDRLRAELATQDGELATEILAEAQASYARMQERIDGAERRATTLQGSSAVAASLTLAGTGLLLDSSKIHGSGWRVAFAAILAYVSLAFVLCAYRATLASSRVHRWVVPPDSDVLRRPGQSVATARTDRAADLLHSIGCNQRFARWKIAMMRASAQWLARALAALLLVALLALAYVITRF